MAGIMCVPYFFLDTMTLSYLSDYNRILVNILMAVMGVCILVYIIKNRPTLPQWILIAGIGLVVFSTIWDMSYYGNNPLGLNYSLMQPMVVVFSLFMFVSAMYATIEKSVEAQNKAVQLRLKVAEQEAEMSKSQTAMLLSQMQDHFLFNTLTAINNLCKDNPPARKAITTFSKYLRENIDALSHNKLTTFESELTHVKQYVWLEQLRFEELVKVEYDIEVDGFLLPVLTVEPIVENAIKHGITQNEEGGTVVIRTEESDDFYKVIISDNGGGFDSNNLLSDKQTGSKKSHTGIVNVKKRLEVMCSGTLEIKSQLDKGTVATITIPKVINPVDISTTDNILDEEIQ